MVLPNKRIIKFIDEHQILTLATSKNNQSWCSNCFYSFISEKMFLVITSDLETRHITEIKDNNKISGSIVLDTNIVGKIQGIQFSGVIYRPNEEEFKFVNKSYLSKFPFALLMNTHLWILELNYIKMTDNRLGFGKKLVWNKNEE